MTAADGGGALVKMAFTGGMPWLSGNPPPLYLKHVWFGNYVLTWSPKSVGQPQVELTIDCSLPQVRNHHVLIQNNYYIILLSNYI